MPALVTRRPGFILAGASLIMLGVLLYVGRWLLFFWDEWSFIFYRPDPTPQALLAPFFDTFVAVPVLVYEALLAVFGLGTYLPYLLVAWSAHFAIAALLYRIVNRRSGVVVGLAAGVTVIFLGSGYEVLLQPFQIQFQFAIAGGLVAIDQLDVGRPAVAAIALLPAVASSGLGVIYAGLIVVWGLIRRHPATVLAAVPAIVAYGVWYLTWGRGSVHVPGPGLSLLQGAWSTLLGIGAAVSGVIGLDPSRYSPVGLALAAAALAGGAILAWRGYRPDPLAIAAIAALTAEQILRVALRGPYGVGYGARSGYVYAGVVFVLLAISSLVGNRLPSRRAVPVIVAVLIVLMRLNSMREFAAAANQIRTMRATELAELQLIEAHRADPSLVMDIQPDFTNALAVTARPYLAAVDRFGRPTLQYEWRPFVDLAAVESARHRLLPGP